MSSMLWKSQSRVLPIKVGPLGVSLKENTHKNTLWNTVRQLLSVRVTFLLIVILQNLLIAGIGWGIMYSFGSQALNDVTDELVNKVSAEMYEKIKGYMAVPPLLLKTSAHHFGTYGIIDVSSFNKDDDKTIIWKHLWAEYSAASTFGFYINTIYGDTMGYRPQGDGAEFFYSWRNTNKTDSLYFYGVNQTTGEPQFTLNATQEVKNFDIEEQFLPWKPAEQKQRSLWSDLYILLGSQDVVVVTGTVPFFDSNNTFLGIVSCDYSVGVLDEFLKNLKVTTNGISYVVDSQGYIVSTSKEGNFREIRDGKLTRQHASEVDNSLIRRSAHALEKTYGAFAKVPEIGEHHLGSLQVTFVRLRDEMDLDWVVVLVIPETEFRSSFTNGILYTLVAILGISLFFITLSAIFTNYITQPIMAIAKNMVALASLKFEVLHIDKANRKAHSRLYEVRAIQKAFSRLHLAMHSFKRYVPEQLVRYLLDQGHLAVLGCKPANVTVFFADIIDFTATVERLSPDAVVEILGLFLEAITNCVLAKQGVVDKFIGDAVMAYWNQEDVTDHARKACEAAILAQGSFKQLSKTLADRGYPNMRFCVGLHCGPVLIGNLGAPERMNYTIIGDGVNLAARLESLNRVYGTEIMMSEAVYEQVKATCFCRELDVVAVKGRTQATRIYELISDHVGIISWDMRRMMKAYEEALLTYINGDFTNALLMFTEYAKGRSNDKAAKVLIERCEVLIASPPKEWNGVFHLQHK